MGASAYRHFKWKFHKEATPSSKSVKGLKFYKNFVMYQMNGILITYR